jgi:hypothetical protein
MSFKIWFYDDNEPLKSGVWNAGRTWINVRTHFVWITVCKSKNINMATMPVFKLTADKFSTERTCTSHLLSPSENKISVINYGNRSVSRDSVVGIAIGYGLDDGGVGVRVPVGWRIFFISTSSRPALGPTQPPIQWVPRDPSPGVNRPRREADHSPPDSAEVKEIVDLYIHSSIRPHGTVFN